MTTNHHHTPPRTATSAAATPATATTATTATATATATKLMSARPAAARPSRDADVPDIKRLTLTTAGRRSDSHHANEAESPSR